MRKKNRFIALIIACLLMISMLSSVCFAAESTEVKDTTHGYVTNILIPIDNGETNIPDYTFEQDVKEYNVTLPDARQGNNACFTLKVNPESIANSKTETTALKFEVCVDGTRAKGTMGFQEITNEVNYQVGGATNFNAMAMKVGDVHSVTIEVGVYDSTSNTFTESDVYTYNISRSLAFRKLVIADSDSTLASYAVSNADQALYYKHYFPVVTTDNSVNLTYTLGSTAAKVYVGEELIPTGSSIDLTKFGNDSDGIKNVPISLQYNGVQTNYELIVANSDQALADAVTKMIGEIGTVSLESKSSIANARALLDELTEEQKALVSEDNQKKLSDAETTYAELKKAADDKAKADKKAASAVSEQIANLGEITLDSIDSIVKARGAYNALTDDQKALISEDTIKALTDAEATYAELKAADDKEKEDLAAAKSVMDKIDLIGDVSIETKDVILDARKAFEELNDNAKTKVTNLNALVIAEKTIEVLENRAEADKAINELEQAKKDLETAKQDYEELKNSNEATKQELEAAKKEVEQAKIALATEKAKNVSISGVKVSSKNKKITVTWKKKSSVAGYQVSYKLKSAKKYKTLKKTTGTKVVSKTLKKGKVYQVKVRSYSTVGGKTIYGKWSTIKKVTVK